MRISDLSARSGVPVPTIKFYLRERLLQPGELTARNQAMYSNDHVERLRLIRICTDIGGANLASVRIILEAINDPQLTLHDLCRAVHRTLYTHQPFIADEDGIGTTRKQVDEYIDGLGWQVDADAPGRGALASIMAALHRFGWDADVDIFAPYAEAADHLASRELEFISPDATRAEAAATVVIGTILFESVLLAMRRLAQEHHSSMHLRGDAGSR
jgi:DNA-binding transcriptional MerR regulator